MDFEKRCFDIPDMRAVHIDIHELLIFNNIDI